MQFMRYKDHMRRHRVDSAQLSRDVGGLSARPCIWQVTRARDGPVSVIAIHMTVLKNKTVHAKDNLALRYVFELNIYSELPALCL